MNSQPYTEQRPPAETAGFPMYAPPGAPDEFYRRSREAAERRQEKLLRLREKARSERCRRIALLSLAAGVFFAYLMASGGRGIGTTVGFLLLECLIFFTFWSSERRQKRRALALAVPAVLIAVSFSLFYSPSSFFISRAALLPLTAVQIVLLSSKSAAGIFSPGMIAGLWRRIVAGPLAHLDLYFRAFRGGRAERGNREKHILTALLGMLAAIPALLLLLALFLSADPVFREGLSDFLREIGTTAVRRAVLCLFFGPILSLGLGSVLIFNAAGEAEAEVLPAGKGLRIPASAGAGFAALIDLLLFAFAFVQLRYLFFSGAYSKVIEEIGYAAYAREGFFELAWASGIVFLLAAALLTCCRGKDGEHARPVRALVLCMCLLNAVVAVSAARRMLLYIGEYGLSVRRVSTLFAILMILLSLAWLAVKCVFPKWRALHATGVSAVALVLIFSFVNIDRLVSSYNREQYLEGRLEADIGYYRQLHYTSAEDLAMLLRAAESGENPELSEQRQNMEDILRARREAFVRRDPLAYTIDDLRVARAFASVSDLIHFEAEQDREG